jgi:hypothetical protein
LCGLVIFKTSFGLTPRSDLIEFIFRKPGSQWSNIPLLNKIQAQRFQKSLSLSRKPAKLFNSITDCSPGDSGLEEQEALGGRFFS